MPKQPGARCLRRVQSSGRTTSAGGNPALWRDAVSQSDQAVELSRRTHSPATHGPRTPTLTRPRNISNRNLLFTCCQICPRSIPQTAVSFPGALIELHAAVETVAGIDGPVAARFTSGERVPGAAIAHRGHFRTRLRAYPQHPVGGRGDNDIGYWQSSGFDPVDLSDGKCYVLNAGRSRDPRRPDGSY